MNPHRSTAYLFSHVPRCFRVAVAIVSLMIVSSCAYNEETGAYQPTNAGVGLGVGALGGAVIGGLVGERRGAALGAVLGGMTGVIIGASLDQQESELRRDLDESDIAITRRSDRLVLEIPDNLAFAADSARIRRGLKIRLDSIAEFLDRNPDTQIEIRGYADSYESPNHRLALADDRALNVGRYLRRRGIHESRIDAYGIGDEEAIADNRTAAGRALNRRVEMTIFSL